MRIGVVLLTAGALLLGSRAFGQVGLTSTKLYVQGDVYLGGQIEIDVVDPTKVGQIPLLAVGLSPLESPKLVAKGPLYIGNLLILMVLPPIPGNGVLKVTTSLPPDQPSLEGLTIVLQAFVGGALGNPATIPFDRQTFAPTQAQLITSPTPAIQALLGDYVAAGDLNGDGEIDLAAGAWFQDSGAVDKAGRAYVFWGPSFASSSSLLPPYVKNYGTFGAGVHIADLDNNGVADLLVGDSPADPPVAPDTSHLFVYPGGPGFSTTPAYEITCPVAGLAAWPYSRSMVVADANSDGWKDIVASLANKPVNGVVKGGAFCIQWGPDFASHVLVENPSPDPFDQFAMFLDVGDIDADGSPEVVVSSGIDNVGGVPPYLGRVYVYDLPGLELLQTIENPLPAVGSPYFGDSMSLHDMDGDGDDDIITSDFKNHLFIFEAPTFSDWTVVAKPLPESGDTSFGYMPFAAEVNGDGWVDLVIPDAFEGTLSGCSFGNSGTLFVCFGPYYATFRRIIDIDPACGNAFSWRTVLVDLDGDGRLDIVAGSEASDIQLQNAGSVTVFRAQ